jgi:hypothetical protein
MLTDPTFDPTGKGYSSGPVTLVKTAGPAVEAGALGNPSHSPRQTVESCWLPERRPDTARQKRMEGP